MTDGVLLNEIGRDRLLRQYDTLIIDEAHERSLNIDFLLGYLARILPRRPDLKLVITSATIDVDRIAKHFTGLGETRQSAGLGDDGHGSADGAEVPVVDRKSTRLNSSHANISYAVFCLKKKTSI